MGCYIHCPEVTLLLRVWKTELTRILSEVLSMKSRKFIALTRFPDGETHPDGEMSKEEYGTSLGLGGVSLT